MAVFASAGAVTIFRDLFDTDTSANWAANQSGDSDTAFGFDYSVVGIPEAPNSSGAFAARKGLRLRAHLSASTNPGTNGISASPLNLGYVGGLSGDYRLSFDAWINYNGPLDVGGTGSSQHLGAGVGTEGAQPIWPGNPSADGLWFAANSDGDVGDTSNAQADYAVLVGNTMQAINNNYYAAGLDLNARGNGHPYYLPFGGSVATAAQIASFPAQTNQVRIGALGMAWHSVVIAKQGDYVTWDVDGYRLATAPANLIVGSGKTNFFLGFFDWFSSVNSNPNMTFALFDNVRAEVFLPVITSIKLINAGADVEIKFTASTTDVNTSFDLQSSTQAGSGYVDLGATINAGNPGEFSVVVPYQALPNVQKFFRVRRL